MKLLVNATKINMVNTTKAMAIIPIGGKLTLEDNLSVDYRLKSYVFPW